MTDQLPDIISETRYLKKKNTKDQRPYTKAKVTTVTLTAKYNFNINLGKGGHRGQFSSARKVLDGARQANKI